MKRVFTTLAVITLVLLACKKEKPATVASLTTTAATNVTANSVTTGGNITNDGKTAITKRGVAWATHTAPTVADSITNDGTGSGSFTSNVSGLMANTIYYIRAYAINGTGTGYGNELSFTTSKGLPTVTTAAITNSVALSATGGGNVLSDGGYPITARGVVWATTHNPTIANFKTTDGTGTGPFTSTLTPLASQTVYYVRGYATTSFGTAYGNEITLTAASSNSIADIDGNVYPTITIGTQTWMTSNLKVTHYRNGDSIVNGYTTNFDWYQAIKDNENSAPNYDVYKGAYTYPNGDVANVSSFGLLYNNFAIDDNRKVCPAGWHVPYYTDWAILAASLGGSAVKTDTTYNGGFYVNYSSFGLIADKLLVGGSSGLNLKFAGQLFIDGANSYSYTGFNSSGFYWMQSFIGYPKKDVIALAGSAQNYWFALGAANSTPNDVRYQADNLRVLSVRCVKD
jgi:uncharacterized protein (TIGR02145 family)